MAKVAINGFGRIGRLVFRSLFKKSNVDITLINDLAHPKNLAYLLKYDSIHGTFPVNVSADDNYLYVGDNKIRVTSEREPEALPYRDLHTDIVVESTGLFRNPKDANKHILAGAKKVVISAPSDAPMFVMGVNHEKYNPDTDHIISCASCTTNCLAPLVQVLHENFEVIEGLMTTVHAVTATQKTQDSASNKDYRGGRGIINNIIPSSTGAAKAVGKVIPDLDGKLTGMALRVPTDDVSIVDLTVKTKKSTSLKEITDKLVEASKSKMKGILGVTEDLIVSSDIKGCSLSSLFDVNASIELNSNFFKLLSWYDNEWGYANRVCEMIDYMLNNTKN